MGHMTSTNERSLLTWAAAHLEVVRSFAGNRIGGGALPRRQLHREPRACPQSHDAHVGRHVPLVNVLSPTAVHMVTRNHRSRIGSGEGRPDSSTANRASGPIPTTLTWAAARLEVVPARAGNPVYAIQR